jgi:predicted site-specific integrase-resolvase
MNKLMTFEQWQALAAKPDDDEVLSLPLWCELNGFSLSTGRRIIDAGEIEVVYLSTQRRGVTRRADREWKARKTRKASSAA